MNQTFKIEDFVERHNLMLFNENHMLILINVVVASSAAPLFNWLNAKICSIHYENFLIESQVKKKAASKRYKYAAKVSATHWQYAVYNMSKAVSPITPIAWHASLWVRWRWFWCSTLGSYSLYQLGSSLWWCAGLLWMVAKFSRVWFSRSGIGSTNRTYSLTFNSLITDW